MNTPNLINMFWIGPRLRWIERLSMNSFLSNGHPVHLHTYDSIKNVPDGVVVCDASETVDYSTVMALTSGRRGAPALAADYFRLVLQKKGRGFWCDSDVISVKPFSFGAEEPIFAFQTEAELNNAVLFLPHDSPILNDALRAFEPNRVPRWVNKNRLVQLWLKRVALQNFGPTDHHWGTLGPASLTWFAKKHGQIALAKAATVFHPYPWQRAHEPFQRGTTIDDFTSEQTLTIHLYNEVLGELKEQIPPEDSAIGKLVEMYGA